MEQLRQLQEENQTLRTHLSECRTKEDSSRKKLLDHEQEMHELNEKYEQKCFSLRLDYENKIEQLTNKTTEQQMEILTFKQIQQTMSEEKSFLNQQIQSMRSNEGILQEKFEQLQIKYEQLLKANRKPLMLGVFTQTVSRRRRYFQYVLYFLGDSTGNRRIKTTKSTINRTNDRITNS